MARRISNKKWLERELAKSHRQKARDKLRELRVALRAARTERKESMRAASEWCRSERLAARERARQLRIRGLAELREATRLEREVARNACSVSKTAAKKTDGIERTRAELEAERVYQREMRRIDAGHKQRRREHRHATYIEQRDESDDEVVQNLEPEFHALWNRLKRGFKGSPRMSRTEEFLKYVELHPDEFLEAISDRTDALVRELEKKEREASKKLTANPALAKRVMEMPTPLEPQPYIDDGIPF
jgi:hypothetical protein